LTEHGLSISHAPPGAVKSLVTTAVAASAVVASAAVVAASASAVAASASAVAVAASAAGQFSAG